MTDLYAPSNAIIQRLEEQLKARYGLREIYSDATLADITADAILTPAIAVTPAAFVVRDVDVESGSTIIETRWQVVAIDRAHNDRGRATRARDVASELVVEIIRHLSAWQPDPAAGPLMLRQVPPPRHAKGKVFIPLVFGSNTRIDAAA